MSSEEEEYDASSLEPEEDWASPKVTNSMQLPGVDTQRVTEEGLSAEVTMMSIT